MDSRLKCGNRRGNHGWSHDTNSIGMNDPRALESLEAAHTLGDGNPLVFPMRSGNPLTTVRDPRRLGVALLEGETDAEVSGTRAGIALAFAAPCRLRKPQRGPERAANRGSQDEQTLASLRTSAEAGDAQAQFNLGAMYFEGRGVPQDDGEACRWIDLASVQGYTIPQATRMLCRQ